MTKPRALSVEAAVKRELSTLTRAVPGLNRSPEAVLALTFAREAQSGEYLRDRVAAARLLGDVMATLRAAAPAEEARDRLDELAEARQRRVGVA